MYGYIYITICIVNKTIYIGQHKAKQYNPKYLGSGTILWNAINKHGCENFENTQIDVASSKEELSKKEISWISYFRNNGFIMYNISTGGEWGDNFTNHPNKEIYRENISKGLKDSEEFQTTVRSPKRRKNVSDGMKNSEKWKLSHNTKEYKEKSSKALTGIERKKGTCIYCGKTMLMSLLIQFHNDHCYHNPLINIEAERLRRKPKKETLEKRSKSLKLVKRTKEWNEKIGLGNVGKNPTIETRKKMSEKAKLRKRKPFTKEHLKNLSIAAIKRERKKKELKLAS